MARFDQPIEPMTLVRAASSAWEGTEAKGEAR
jgi:hypothetical protein